MAKQNFVDVTPMELFVLSARFNAIDISGTSNFDTLLFRKGYLKMEDGQYVITPKGEAFIHTRCQVVPDFKQVIIRNTPEENLKLMNAISYHCFKTATKLQSFIKKETKESTSSPEVENVVEKVVEQLAEPE